MNLATVLLLIVLLLVLVGVVPVWPHSAAFGYAPGGIVFILLLVVVVLAVAGRL